MGKKLALLVIAGLIGAAVVGVMSASAKSSAGATATYLDHTVSSHDIDNGAPGFGPGDQFTSHDVLKQNGNKVGTLDSYCEVTNLVGHSAFIVCTAGAKLSGGQIEFQAKLYAGQGNPPFDVAVVGGTGQYRTARGYAHITPIKGTNGNDSKLQLYLVP